MRNRWMVVVLGLLLGLGGLFSHAQLVEKLLKAGGIALVVDRLGPEMDRAVNRLTNTKPNRSFATKVVPIISVGTGAYVGVAQVMGKPDLVKRVQAVAQIESNFAGRQVRIRVLVPISTRNPGKRLERVEGVGISGLLDIRL